MEPVAEKEYAVLDKDAQEILATNLHRVQEQIAEAAQRVGRSSEEITLVAISKTRPLSMVKIAYDMGIRNFGENRVQEALTKIEAFRPSDVHWHLVGHLQTNKVGKVASQFDLIHSVDSLHLAEALNRVMIRHSGLRQPVLLQVNISGESSKEGVSPADTIDLACQVAALPGLEIQGLMTIAPLVDHAEKVRPIFQGLRELRDHLRDAMPQCSWQHLSMGMTDDYQVAIEEGATIVRIGRAIFGERIV